MKEASGTITYDIRSLSKWYTGQTQPANKNINLEIYEGEIFGILGDNGSGKTTLVRQMMNLIKSTSGYITLWQQPIEQDPLFIPLHVGYMPQEAFALNSLKVGETLYFTAHLRGLSRRAARLERDRLLDLWQIEHLYHQPSSRLSGGQRRLLQLAVAMAGSPPILVLDEPTNDLAPQRRRQVWDVLRRLNSEQETTIIFITHDALEAEKVVHRVGIMQSGKLVATGQPSQLKQKVDETLRLELFFSPQTLPNLSPELAVRQIEAGRWIVYLERAQVNETLNQLDMSIIDDFRLYSATLEDLYMYYVRD
jgi:ABC-type multidrug transport system ATPase subunit